MKRERYLQRSIYFITTRIFLSISHKRGKSHAPSMLEKMDMCFTAKIVTTHSTSCPVNESDFIRKSTQIW